MSRSIVFLLIVLLGLTARHRWLNLDGMGERRAQRVSNAGDEILVGISWPFDDAHQGLADGLRLAMDDINAAGERQITLVMRNETDQWSDTQRIAREFSRDTDVVAVIGLKDDGMALRSSAMYERSRLLHMVVGSTSNTLTDHDNPYIVHTIVAADRVARSLAQAGTGKSYALVWEKDTEWDSLVSEYRIAQDSRNTSIAYQHSYTRGHADFRRAVNELKTVGADQILFVGAELAATDFLGRANAVGLAKTIVCVCPVTPGLKSLAGASRADVMLLDFYDEQSSQPANAAFVTRFKARHGRLPDTWAAQGYDALMLLDQALHATTSRRSDELALALQDLPEWEGANGKYKFDPTGEIADKPVFLKQYRNGVVVKVLAVRGVLEDLRPPGGDRSAALSRP